MNENVHFSLKTTHLIILQFLAYFLENIWRRDFSQNKCFSKKLLISNKKMSKGSQHKRA